MFVYFPVRPLDVRILGSNGPLSAGSIYEMSCQSHGSRPPALVSWHKDGLPLTEAPTREIISEDGNSTTSILSLTPQVADSGKTSSNDLYMTFLDRLFIYGSDRIPAYMPRFIFLSTRKFGIKT